MDFISKLTPTVPRLLLGLLFSSFPALHLRGNQRLQSKNAGGPGSASEQLCVSEASHTVDMNFFCKVRHLGRMASKASSRYQVLWTFPARVCVGGCICARACMCVWVYMCVRACVCVYALTLWGLGHPTVHKNLSRHVSNHICGIECYSDIIHTLFY